MRPRIAPIAFVAFVSLAAGLSVPRPAFAASVPKVGRVAVVDLQSVLEKTKHGKRSRKKLEKAVADKQRALDKERARLEAEIARLSNLPPKERAQAQASLQQATAQWQQDAMNFEAEMAKMESDMLEAIYDNVATIVKKLSKEQGLDIVFVKDQMTIVYVAPSLDLTDEVIRRYDKAHK